MPTSHDFAPDWVSAPGDTIVDALAERSISREELATALKESVANIDRLLVGELPLTMDIIRRLVNIVGGSKEFWLNREALYRRSLVSSVPKAEGGTEEWLHDLPVKEMVRFGWIKPASTKHELLERCLAFFDVDSLFSWRVRHEQLLAATAFRSSMKLASRVGAVAAWLRQGEIEAESIACAKWNRNLFSDALERIRKLTRKRDPAAFLPELVEECAKSGVAVVVVRAPAGCRASGATRFLSATKAVLQFSFRYLSDDQFWFTFFHEAGHVLLHPSSRLFLEGVPLDLAAEQAANEFALDSLIPRNARNELSAMPLNRYAIRQFALRIGISPGIVVGQLQFMGRARRDQLNMLKARYRWTD